MKIVQHFYFINLCFIVILSIPDAEWFCDGKNQKNVVILAFMNLFESHKSIVVMPQEKIKHEKSLFISIGSIQSSIMYISSTGVVGEKKIINNFQSENELYCADICDVNYESVINRICKEAEQYVNYQITKIYFWFEYDKVRNVQFFRRSVLKENIEKCKEVFTRFFSNNLKVQYFTFEMTQLLRSRCMETYTTMSCIHLQILKYKILIFIESDFFDVLKNKLKQQTKKNEEANFEQLFLKNFERTCGSKLEKEYLFILSMVKNIKYVFKNSNKVDIMSNSRDYLVRIVKILLCKKDFANKLKEILENNKEIAAYLIEDYIALSNKNTSNKHLPTHYTANLDMKTVSDMFYYFLTIAQNSKSTDISCDFCIFICNLLLGIFKGSKNCLDYILSENCDTLGQIKSIRDERSKKIVSNWLCWSTQFVKFLREPSTELFPNNVEGFIKLREKCFNLAIRNLNEDNIISFQLFCSYEKYIMNNTLEMISNETIENAFDIALTSY